MTSHTQESSQDKRTTEHKNNKTRSATCPTNNAEARRLLIGVTNLTIVTDNANERIGGKHNFTTRTFTLNYNLENAPLFVLKIGLSNKFERFHL